MITIKELAQELHVSEQALRQWCKRNEIKKITKGKITSYFLDENTVESIRNHYTTQRKQSTTNAQRKSNESSQTLDILKATIDTLTNQLAEKDKQLFEKDKQLALRDKQISDAVEEREKLTAERQTTLARLFSLEDTNKELQMELNKYKVIADSKQTVVEVDSVNEPAETEAPEPKLSFFERLFRRSKRSE